MMSSIKNAFDKPFFFVLVALVIAIGYGMYNIADFITADEHFWLPNYGSERIQEYWQAIGEHDWDHTRINDKPGITLAYLSGIALPFAEHLIPQQIPFYDGVARIYNPEITKKINILFRTPLFLFNCFFVAFYLYWILKKVTGSGRVASFATIFMLLSPVLLGLNQIVNPDTPFWTFGIATFFTFYAVLKFREARYVWLATLFFGLMLASKYVGIIFFPFFLLMIGIDYLYRYEEYQERSESFAGIIKQDIKHYYRIAIGSIAIFVILMPAAITDTNSLFGSKEAFDLKNTFPIFYAIFAITGAFALDAWYNKGRGTLAFFGSFAKFRGYIEGIMYVILLLTTLFVLFNWISKNSLYDLSRIPFDAKTKASFTTNNPFLVRYIVEFVPLVFALTPLTLFLLIFSWAHSLLSSFRERRLVFVISMFFLIFYLAVIQQGLLVTVRYSILLFPLALTLSAFMLDNLTNGKKKRPWLTRFYLGILGMFCLGSGIVTFHGSISTPNQILITNFIGKHNIISTMIALCADTLFVVLTLRLFAFKIFSRLSTALVACGVIMISTYSLTLAYPHYFVYVNSLLPDRYLLSAAWGYGGYEAATYLNAKPNAKDLTLWTDAHGACEFFVGKCIHRSKVDTNKYHIDYLYQTLRGQLSPKFPYHVDKLEWEYFIGDRRKNFVRLYHNAPFETPVEDTSFEKQP